MAGLRPDRDDLQKPPPADQHLKSRNRNLTTRPWANPPTMTSRRGVAHDGPGNRGPEHKQWAASAWHVAIGASACCRTSPVGDERQSVGRGKQQETVVAKRRTHIAVHEVVGHPGTTARRTQQSGSPVEWAARKPPLYAARIGVAQVCQTRHSEREPGCQGRTGVSIRLPGATA